MTQSQAATTWPQFKRKSLISADAAVNKHGQPTQLLLQTQHIVYVLY